MRKTAKTAVVALVAGLWPAILASPASTHEYRGRTAGVFEYDSAKDEWRGRVGSLVKACERRRRVKLQKLDGESWETVAKTRSKRSGRWRIEMEDADGSFRVVVPARTKVTIEHDHRCDRFASPIQEAGDR